MYESHGGHRAHRDGCLLCAIVDWLAHLERKVDAMSDAQSNWNTQVQRLTDDWSAMSDEVSSLRTQTADLAQKLEQAASDSQSAADRQMASDASDLAGRLDAFEKALNASSTPEGGTSPAGPSDPTSGDPTSTDGGQTTGGDTGTDAPAQPAPADPTTPVSTDPNDPNAGSGATGGSDTSSEGGTTGADPVATGADGTDQPSAAPDSPTDESGSTVIPGSDAN